MPPGCAPFLSPLEKFEPRRPNVKPLRPQGMAGRPWAADECLQRRQDQTQRRLTNACKALAQIRKLLGPNIQINVAEQEVNVMSS